MKNIIIVAVILALGAGARVWFAARRNSEEPHKHVPVQATDAEGRVYYTCAMHPQVRQDTPGSCPICGMQLVKRQEKPAARSEPEILYWYDPMKPEVHFDKPGKSPFMDMELVPKYADPAGDGAVTIDPRMVQNLGVRTARAERGTFYRRVDAAGAIAFDERSIQAIESRAAGWVERLHARAVNDPVRRGQVLAEVYAPELYAAQQEYLLTLRMAGGKNEDALVAAGRERLLLLGLSRQQIERIEASGEAARRVVYYAPFDGIIAELGVREGQQVAPGTALFRLVDLSQVWITAQIPEAQAAWITAGRQAEAQVPSLPGRLFTGRVDYLYPELNRETRTVPARIVLDNPGRELKPGMYADVTLFGGARTDVLTVPSEALIPTGDRTVVIVAEGAGRFRPVEVRSGAEREGRTEILDGLAEGQEVVVSGQFLIDSEASLRGAFSRLTTPAESEE